MWSFDRFFKEVTNILSKNVVHVFYMNCAASIEVYMNHDEPFFNLKEHIKLQTEVQPENQILIVNNADMEETFDSNTLVKNFPPTTDTKPVFLYLDDREWVENTKNHVTLPVFFRVIENIE